MPFISIARMMMMLQLKHRMIWMLSWKSTIREKRRVRKKPKRPNLTLPAKTEHLLLKFRTWS